MTFGEKLKDARTKADMTQAQLAERLNVSRQAISKWEADKGMPDIENLKLISKTLQVSIDYLLDDVTDVDLKVIREKVNWGGYEVTGADSWIARQLVKKPRWRRFYLKDSIVRSKFPNGEIHRLYSEQRNTKFETAVDFILLCFTWVPGIVDLVYAVNNIDKTFYLVYQDGKRYLVLITDEYFESRQLPDSVKMKKKWFRVGRFEFRDQGLLK